MNHTIAKPKPKLSINLPHHNDMRGWYLLCFGNKETDKIKKKDSPEEEESTAMETDNTETITNISNVTSIGQHALPPLMSIVAHLDQVRFIRFISEIY